MYCNHVKHTLPPKGNHKEVMHDQYAHICANIVLTLVRWHVFVESLTLCRATAAPCTNFVLHKTDIFPVNGV